MSNMKYQTLILIFVLLVSTYFLKDRDVFSNPNEVGKAVMMEAMESETDDKSGEVLEEKSVENEEIILPEILVERPLIEESQDGGIVSCQSLESKIALAKAIEDGKVIIEKDANNRWPMASITKLMTTLVAMENFNLADQIKISKEILDQVGEFKSFSENSIYSVNDLIKASLVFSSNDASYALAGKIGNDEFIKKMNDKAQSIGMTQTKFFEPSGLSYLNQSTANDLYTLIKYIYRQYPVLLDMTRQKTVSIKERVTNKNQKFSNINLFAGRKEFFGGKTGFIEQSGGNLVTLFFKNGKIFVLAVMSSDNRFSDIEKMYNCLP